MPKILILAIFSPHLRFNCPDFSFRNMVLR
jgi:hypothetical protein